MANPMTRRLQGVVVSDAMDKTIVVRVDRVRVHPKYKKRYTVHKKYAAHDARNQYHVGDAVTIVASRPFSKTKRWRVLYDGQPSEDVVETPSESTESPEVQT